MKKTSLPVSILFLTCGLLLVQGRAEERVRGPLPQEQRDLIHHLAEHHEELVRKVTMREDGYKAVTTTSNKDLATKLKAHFRYMQKRLGSGGMVRRWDPAFAELVEFHDEITTEVDYLEDGIQVTVKGKTPKAVKVAQNHARIVSGFAGRGTEAVHQEHERALK